MTSRPALDPQAASLLEVIRALGNPRPHELPVEQAREQMRAAFVTRGEPIPLHDVKDRLLPSSHGPLAMRLYRPRAGRLAMVLFLHGGGWVQGDLDTHDRLCRRLAASSGCLLAALHYRRAPEHKHPAPLEDAMLAYRWLRENAEKIEGDPSRLAVAGESSGATTAACLTLQLRDLGAPLPVMQALVYPIVDSNERWPSFAEYRRGYPLDEDFIAWSLASYVPEGQSPSDPYLFPMHAEDLTGLPPAVVMTAEFDPLRDGGIAYASRLAAAGVEVEHVHAGDQMHSFLLLDRAVQRVGALIEELGDALAKRLASSAPLGS